MCRSALMPVPSASDRVPAQRLQVAAILAMQVAPRAVHMLQQLQLLQSLRWTMSSMQTAATTIGRVMTACLQPEVRLAAAA